jgi:glutaconate CoA-transferase subunit B
MSSDYSTSELMAVAMARSFADGEVVVMGAVPALPMAACRLARALHAPNLSFVVGGSGTVNPEPAALPRSSCDPALAPASSTLPLPDVVLLEGRGDAFDVFCAGGLQIDMYGNCNLIVVGDWANPVLRGPGTVGLPFLPATGRAVLYSAAHSPRVFVERVDFVSGPGHPSEPGGRPTQGGAGPSLVVTSMAVLDFDTEDHRMRLVSVHPGTTEAEVREATGFELPPGPPAPQTEPPTPEELVTLRSIDSTGLLSEQER